MTVGTHAPTDPLAKATEVQADMLRRIAELERVLGSTGSRQPRNLIHNPSGLVWQRNAAVNTSGARQWSVDRWGGESNGGGVVTLDRESGGGRFPYWIRAATQTADASIAAGDYNFMAQRLEGFDVQHLLWGTSAAKDIAISFWHKSFDAGTYCLYVRNAAGTRSYVATWEHPGGWEPHYVTLRIPGCTDGTWETNANASLEVGWSMGNGTTYRAPTANAWQNGNYLSVAGVVTPISTVGRSIGLAEVQVEVGTSSSQFAARPLAEELLICQRYLQVLWADGSTNVQAHGHAYATTHIVVHRALITKMRAIPTLAVGGSWQAVDGGSAFGLVAPSLNGADVGTDHITMVAAAEGGAVLTQFRPYYLRATSTSAFLRLSAEI